MSGSMLSRKAANNNAEPKPLSKEEVYSLPHSLRSEVSSLKSAKSSDAAKMQPLKLELSSTPVLSPYHQQLNTVFPAYDWFMQELYRAVDRSSHLQQDGFNFAKWVAGLNRVLGVAFNSELLVNDLPLLLGSRSPQETEGYPISLMLRSFLILPSALVLYQPVGQQRSSLMPSKQGAVQAIVFRNCRWLGTCLICW
ncbi:hypothetical protein O181_029962 [Austropuccinia psidii MF-1]|uniref:Uncharacterized protein n=1 Tax=Austropuccinia psidii MF-1 TaxID=1389203 RepID=A0A9Q3CXL9_9BASI|nr:hypothetical protein [Austropuccinia psidii MF-1]